MKMWQIIFGTGATNVFIVDEDKLQEFYGRVYAHMHSFHPEDNLNGEFKDLEECIMPALIVNHGHHAEMPEGYHRYGKDNGCNCGRLQYFEGWLAEVNPEEIITN